MIGAVAKRLFSGRLGAVAVKVPCRTIYPSSSSNHVAGMPRNRISFQEKIATGIFLGCAILGTPAWILTHLDDYRGGPATQDEEEDE